MSNVLKLENYLSISPNKFGIYLFDTNDKKIYIKKSYLMMRILVL